MSLQKTCFAALAAFMIQNGLIVENEALLGCGVPLAGVAWHSVDAHARQRYLAHSLFRKPHNSVRLAASGAQL